MSHRARTLVASVTLVALAATACGSGSGGGGSTTADSHDRTVHLNVGISVSTGSIAVYLAEKKGYFTKQGLDVSFSTVQSGADAVPKLLNGSLDIALGDVAGTMSAAANGVPLRVVGVANVAATDPSKDYSGIVASNPDIASAASLEGKTVAVNQLNGTAELAVKAAVDNRGADSSKVKFIELPFPQMVAAVKAGRVDAALVADPFLSVGLGAGLHDVLAPQAYGLPGLPSIIFVSSQKYASSAASTIHKFIVAMTAADKAANADPATARSVATFTGLPAKTLKTVRLPIFAENPADTSGMRTLLTLMQKYKVLTKQPDMDALLGTGGK